MIPPPPPEFEVRSSVVKRQNSFFVRFLLFPLSLIAALVAVVIFCFYLLANVSYGPEGRTTDTLVYLAISIVLWIVLLSPTVYLLFKSWWKGIIAFLPFLLIAGFFAGSALSVVDVNSSRFILNPYSDFAYWMKNTLESRSSLVAKVYKNNTYKFAFLFPDPPNYDYSNSLYLLYAETVYNIKPHSPEQIAQESFSVRVNRPDFSCSSVDAASFDNVFSVANRAVYRSVYAETYGENLVNGDNFSNDQIQRIQYLIPWTSGTCISFDFFIVKQLNVGALSTPIAKEVSRFDTIVKSLFDI